MQHSKNILCLTAWEGKGTKLHIDAGMLTLCFILLLFSKNFICIVFSFMPLYSSYKILTNPSFIIPQTLRGYSLFTSKVLMAIVFSNIFIFFYMPLIKTFLMSELKQPWFMKDGQIFKYYIHKIKKLAKHMLTDDNFIQSPIWLHRRMNKKKA